jgi:hypothetical protein
VLTELRLKLLLLWLGPLPRTKRVSAEVLRETLGKPL